MGVAAAGLALRDDQHGPPVGDEYEPLISVATHTRSRPSMPLIVPRGVLADFAFALVLCVLLFKPIPTEPQSSGFDMDGGWEPLLDHLLSPLIALFLYASST